MTTKYFIMLWLAFLTGSNPFAQSYSGLNKDSLQHALVSMPDDSSKVALLITLGQQYEGNQPDSAIAYYKAAERLSLVLKYHTGFIRYVSNYTAVLNVRGKLDESLQLNLQALDTTTKYGLGGVDLMRCLVNTGSVYQQKEDYRSALTYYLRALPLLEAAGNAQNLALIYSNLVGIYRNLNQYDKALVYASQALEQAEKIHDLGSIGPASINMGNVLNDKHRFAEGIRYIEKAYAIGLQLHDSNMVETALIDIGDSYMKQNKPEKYIPVYRQALPLARALEDVSGQCYAMLGLAEGHFWTAQYTAADSLLLQAIAFARQHDQKEVLRTLLLLMSDVQIALGHAAISRVYREQYDSVGNIVSNASLLQTIQEMETKYEVAKKEADLLKKDLQLEAKDRQAVRQRTLLIAAIAGILLLTVLVMLTWRFSRQKQQLQVRTIQALEAEQESVRLKAMLEGQQNERQRISLEMHDDMGSGLTSLLFLSRGLVGVHAASAANTTNIPNTPDTPNTPAGSQTQTALKMRDTTEQLIRKMNEIVWTMNHEQDTLDSLFAYIRVNTAEMLELAGIDFQFQVADPITDVAVTQEFRRNLYLVAKEAVHNVIRHSGADKVIISMSAGIQRLEIDIQDNGKGFDPGGERRFGNGLKNMRRRMEQIGGNLAFSSGKGTQVSISAPLPTP